MPEERLAGKVLLIDLILPPKISLMSFFQRIQYCSDLCARAGLLRCAGTFKSCSTQSTEKQVNNCKLSSICNAQVYF